MASSDSYYYTDADTVISRHNVKLPEPVQETTKSSKNEGAKCAIVISSIALLIAVIGVCIAAIGVIMLNNNGYFKAGRSDVQHPHLQPDFISRTTIQPTQVSHEVKSGIRGIAVYTRWGSTSCPASASLIYKGIAGGKYYSSSGSGSNYLCLPETPEYDEYNTAGDSDRAYVHSAEYQVDESLTPGGKGDHDVPCAVCQSNNGSSLVMIPAKNTCPDAWTREYYGYLMAERNSHHSSEFVCVDRDLEIRPGSVANKNGALFYPAEGRCSTNLPCLPYINGAELTCVVCMN